MKDISKYQPKNILVIQQRQLGDVVVTTPVFAHIKKKFPQTRLTFLTEVKCLPLVQYDPNLDEIICFEKGKSFWQQIQFYLNLHKKKFDVVLDLQQLPRCQVATLFSGATYKLTFNPRHKYRKILYTHFDAPENTEDYTAFSKCRMLSPLGIVAQEMQPRLYVLEKERQKAKEILFSLGLDETKKFITLDATHKHPKRRWKYFAPLVEKILTVYPEFSFFILRAPGEDEQVQHLLEIDTKRVLMPKEPLSLRESMACMEKASFHIGNTSAPQHMALALNVPALIILAETACFWHFNPKNPQKGGAKQIEVRLANTVLQEYEKEKLAYEKGENPTFLQEEFPLINLITVENTFEKFVSLVQEPYYR